MPHFRIERFLGYNAHMRTRVPPAIIALALVAWPLRAQEPAPDAPPPEAPPPEAPPAEPAPETPPPAPPPPPAAAPAPAPVPAAPAAPAEASAAPAPTAESDEPSVEEKRLVAYVATGVAVVSLASGITFGLLANAQYQCAADVIACNQGRANKIVGEELFDERNEIEQKAIAADISYLFAATAALVATVNYLQGFVFTDDAGSAE